MFNMLDIGERAGSGIPNIYHVWKDQKWGTPQIEEKYSNFERVLLTLPIKSNDAGLNADSRNNELSGLNKRQIDALVFFKTKGKITSSEYAEKYNITDRTARTDLNGLVEKELLIREGEKKSTKYDFR
jgi:predicted HTH transcriptional regulator